MTAFRWRLDVLLRIRGFELERARRTLARARAHETAARRHAADASARTDATARALDERMRMGALAFELPGAIAQLDVTRAERAAAMRQADRASANVATALDGVLQALRRVRALEKLRERARGRHEMERARREQSELEELARQSAAGAGGAT